MVLLLVTAVPHGPDDRVEPVEAVLPLFAVPPDLVGVPVSRARGGVSKGIVTVPPSVRRFQYRSRAASSSPLTETAKPAGSR